MASNKSNHPIQNQLLFVTEPRTGDISMELIYILSYINIINPLIEALFNILNAK
jgi:hypothetical protein